MSDHSLDTEIGAARARGLSLGQRIGLFGGPVVGLAIALAPPPSGLEPQALWVAGLLALMAIWWAAEAVPIAITSLLPLVALPLMGMGTMREITSPYANDVVLLLLGGFIVAIGVEKWNLHRRIALNILMVSGARIKLLIAGFMVATAALSMWISNGATTMMMAPIALSVALASGGGQRVAVALLLGVAYAASIGGLGTPVGTPTNLIAIGWLEENAGVTVSFADWMAVGVPVMLMMLPAAWLVVTWGVKSDLQTANAARGVIVREHAGLGRISTPEARVAMVFGATALLWMLREQLVKLPLLGGLTDMGIAIMGAMAMFLVPHGARAGEPGARKSWALLGWDDAKAVPWDVVLLFGGGLAVAGAVQRSGLAGWLGTALGGLEGAAPLLIILVIVTIIIFLTEIMSNVAAMTTFLPVLGALAVALGGGADVTALVMPAAMAASCAFMLPIATAPNAVVYGTHQVTIGQMARTGFLLNLLCVAVVVGFFALRA